MSGDEQRGAGRFTTVLDGLEVTMGLGIHDAELAAPQRVVLTVSLTCEYGPDRFADAIGSVVDYDFVRDGIRALVAGRHFQLQETLCEEVAALCFADPRVREVRVRSMKPDIYPDASVGCEIIRTAG